MQDQDFWRRNDLNPGADVPGLFDFGTGLYGMRAGRREADQRLRATQDPYYQQASAAAGDVLTRAGSMDPKAAAAERFAAQQGLLAGSDAASEDQLMRMLHSRGMLGVANFNPDSKTPLVPGFDPATMGVGKSAVAMNPHMAAFYAARGGRDARMAADSLNAGEQQLDRELKRAGMLNDQAVARQRANVETQKLIPSRAASTMNLLKGTTGILKDTGVMKDLGGLFGKGFDWLGGATGLWGGAEPELLNSWWS